MLNIIIYLIHVILIARSMLLLSIALNACEIFDWQDPKSFCLCKDSHRQTHLEDCPCLISHS